MKLQTREARKRAAGKDKLSTSAPKRYHEESIAISKKEQEKTKKQELEQWILPSMGRIIHSAFFPFLFTNFDPAKMMRLSWNNL